MTTVLYGWLAVDALIWVLILLVAVRTADRRKDFRVGPDHEPCAADVLVSVIIPARDEAPRIGDVVGKKLKGAFTVLYPIKMLIQSSQM